MAALAAAYGDFAAALSELDAVDRAVAAASDARSHAFAAILRAEIEVEIGRPVEAARAAASYVKRKDAWTAITNGPDPTPRLAYIARRGDALSRAEFEAARKAWLDVQRGETKSDAWVLAYGSAETDAEVAEAMSALPAAGPPKTYYRHAERAGDVGRILLVAGKTDEGLRILEIGARSCLELLYPVRHAHAGLWLADAYTRKSRKADACAVYGKLVTKWKDAKPRSITVDAARLRMKQLGCES
jgi:hypothetical protein